ncbi:GTP cyclohydrolase 1 type 2/Nif3 [Thermoascus aurantiacus ATCC 26904]
MRLLIFRQPARILLTRRPPLTAIYQKRPTRLTRQTYYPSFPTSRTMSSTTTTRPVTERYKLVFFVPHPHLEACKEAVFATGAGTFPGGKYSKCCWQCPGTGQFLPGDGANPNIGEVGTLEKVEEMRVEILCVGKEVMRKAVEALLKAHPYEEPAYEVYKLEDV